MLIITSSLYLSYVILAIFIYELLRRHLKFSWVFYLGMPLLLTPYWIWGPANHDWFAWAKLYSVLIYTYFILLARTLPQDQRKWFFRMIYVVTLLNMGVAIVRCWELKESVPAILNGISGVLLVVSLPKIRTMQIASPYHDFTWDVPYTWIWGYTFWDFLFVYLVFPKSTFLQIALLLAPLVISLFNRKTYPQARAFTLSLFMFVGFTFPFLIEYPPMIESAHPIIAWIGALCTLLYILTSAIWTRKRSSGC